MTKKMFFYLILNPFKGIGIGSKGQPVDGLKGKCGSIIKNCKQKNSLVIS